MIKTKRVSIAATLSVFALVVGACGGDDDAATPTTAAPATTVAPDDDAATTTTEAPDDDAATTTAAPAATTTTVAPAPSYPTSGPCDATVPGTQINYGVFFPNAAFDPPGSSGALVGGTEIAAVYDSLMIFDPETLTVRPHLAESLTPDNDDFTEWTLKLRDGITYSDGTPLTAQLVSDNIDRYFAPEGVRNTSGGFLQYIDEKEAVDDLTLKMTLNTSFAEFGIVFADEPGMIVNTNAIGDDINAFRVQPPAAAGVGPYIVERNVPGEETILVARDDYWGGPVCIERIRFIWIPGSVANYEAFRNGEVDVAFLRDPTVNATAVADGNDGIFFNQDGGAMLNFNHRDGKITSDPRIREAIALAIDPDVINDRAYQGALVTTKAYFGPNSAFYSDAMEPMPIDTARAAELVAEVKAEGWDGAISFVGGNAPPGPDTALAIEGMLRAVGFDVQTELLPTGESIGRLGSGDFELITNGFNSGPDTMVLSMIRNLSSTSPTNRMGYKSDAMDALLAEALATPYEDLQDVLVRINAQINEEFPVVTYGSISEGAIWTSEVKGITPQNSTIFMFHAAYIDG